MRQAARRPRGSVRDRHGLYRSDCCILLHARAHRARARRGSDRSRVAAGFHSGIRQPSQEPSHAEGLARVILVSALLRNLGRRLFRPRFHQHHEPTRRETSPRSAVCQTRPGTGRRADPAGRRDARRSDGPDSRVGRRLGGGFQYTGGRRVRHRRRMGEAVGTRPPDDGPLDGDPDTRRPPRTVDPLGNQRRSARRPHRSGARPFGWRYADGSTTTATPVLKPR